MTWHPDFDHISGTLDVRVCGRRVPVIEINDEDFDDTWIASISLGERPLYLDMHVSEDEKVSLFLHVDPTIEERINLGMLQADIIDDVIVVRPAKFREEITPEARLLTAVLDSGWMLEIKDGNHFWQTYEWLQTLETRSGG